MSYAVLHRESYHEAPITLRAVARNDREPIRRWRNDQISVLRQKHLLTEVDQDAYFDTEVLPDQRRKRPRNILMSILEDGRLVGYGGLVHIAWEDRRAEVSFLLDTGIAGTPAETGVYLPAFHAVMKRIAFGELGFVKLTLETFAFRTDFLAAYPALGYEPAGRWRTHVYEGGRFHDSQLHECLCPENLPGISAAT